MGSQYSGDDINARVFIGTSNVVLPGAKHTFPAGFQASSRLLYYSTLFNSVEINSTFYKVPRYKTLERWVHETDAQFRFTTKLSRYITHQKTLQFNAPDIDEFFEVLAAAKSKSACLLVQFPASITEDYFELVAAILKRIHRNNRDHRWHICVEFRHDSWYEAHVYRILSKLQAHMVFHDKRGSRTPGTIATSAVVYLRFHGPNGDYRGSYGNEFLLSYAKRIHEWVMKGKTVYAYFNNTMGSAFTDAQLLKSLIEDQGSR